MNQPAKAQEPSMEEILASIRRIISDDDAKPAAAAPAETAPAPAPPKPAAAKPAPPPPAPAPAPAKNSQEDIDAMLASFDAPAPVAAAPAVLPVEEEAEDEDEDVFELTEQMAMPAATADGFQKVEPHDDLEITETPPPAPKIEEPPVLSGTTAKAVESAFNSLATTVLTNNARTLEDLVKEMLRPMLKAWLDDNLPTLVERIVKAEIERVARGR